MSAPHAESLGSSEVLPTKKGPFLVTLLWPPVVYTPWNQHSKLLFSNKNQHNILGLPLIIIFSSFVYWYMYRLKSPWLQRNDTITLIGKIPESKISLLVYSRILLVAADLKFFFFKFLASSYYRVSWYLIYLIPSITVRKYWFQIALRFCGI